ncbi:ethanolamine ammonia-lyase [Burkholderia sp. WAC0059]|uniref:ethanolamine ammonia-lyase subunit EutC n=1 Tax=Burkholderia sp. WAC0059 TaxID=2066022 RepID=UPI000C7F644B|nr:ethanolamine ammonia-lyase subunit EutC [Burkholderia sp. WAC0059]PLZ00278.1 ethanolamine ammonia-lyase [Burkholderia sp. WAC0059]
MNDFLEPNPWQALRRFTPARIALGRAGSGLPTAPLLAFNLAHAQARDAVHRPLDAAALHAALNARGWASLDAHSAAPDRAHYLRRPDLGRQLADASRERLRGASAGGDAPDLVFVVADGLSALAAARHALPLLETLVPKLAGWRIGPVVVARQARVALGDEIGELLRARCVAVLVGERPGLSSPDSLGVYLTWAPRAGRTDAERNCVSNVRPEGLVYAAAAHRLHYLLGQARRLGLTGVSLKDDSDAALPGGATGGEMGGGAGVESGGEADVEADVQAPAPGIAGPGEPGAAA